MCTLFVHYITNNEHICPENVQNMSSIENKKAIKLLEASTYNEFELRLIRSFLPLNYADLIREKLESDISTKTIVSVLNGGRRDHHNIIEAAINIALEEKKKMEANSKKIALLSK